MIPSSVWLLFGDEEHEWFDSHEEADEACEDSNLDVEEGYDLAFVEEYVPKSTLARYRAMEAEMRDFLLTDLSDWTAGAKRKHLGHCVVVRRCLKTLDTPTEPSP